MVSKEVYSVACIELLRRLWMELERVHVAERAAPPHGGGLTSRLPSEMLRLELALLLDACRSERWRRLLDISQRLSLMSTLTEVFDALNSSSEIVSQDVIAWAQNRLLDAILEHCAKARITMLSPSTLRQGAAHLHETSCHEVIDRSEGTSILRSGPSAPNGGRSSVRMGVNFDDTGVAAGRPSG